MTPQKHIKGSFARKAKVELSKCFFFCGALQLGVAS